MKLAEAVAQYVSRRREEGAQFIGTSSILRALCKHTGDISLESLSEGRIATFLNSSHCGLITSRSKHSVVRCFLRFWLIRDRVRALRLPQLERGAVTPPPFIYTLVEIRQLLHSTEKCQRFSKKMSSHTLRIILLTLYATGARLDEVLDLRRSCIDLKRKRIVFAANPWRRGRSIPIGEDLRTALASYIHRHRLPDDRNGLLFCCTNGQRVSSSYLYDRFKRLVAIAGVNLRTLGRIPRLRDFRYTFAVHRLTHWIRQKADLNVLMPALSTYMGYASLTKAEEFLSYTPERFRYDLRKLSPKKGRRHWRDQPKLLRALASL